jgi:hypothetical protein
MANGWESYHWDKEDAQRELTFHLNGTEELPEGVAPLDKDELEHVFGEINECEDLNFFLIRKMREAFDQVIEKRKTGKYYYE